MQSSLKIVSDKQTTEFSSIIVTYQSEEGLWRGFVVPFDITFEASSRDEVLSVLKDMQSSYLEGLKKYDNAPHLANVPLSHLEDNRKWQDILIELMNKLHSGVSKIENSDYYAEAQIPA